MMATDQQALAVRETSEITAIDTEQAAGALQHILATGDLAQLSNEQRVGHYLHLCQSLGLNPASRPFDWIEFYDPETRGKKLQLYPNQSAAAQLRRNHQISVHITRRENVGDLHVVSVEGRTPNGRTGEASKYVPITDKDGRKLSGQRLGNAYMKAETGAMRRLTFAMVGMVSPPDPDELRDVREVIVDGAGNIIHHPSQMDRALADDPRLARAIGAPRYEDLDAGTSPLAGTASQAPRLDELEVERMPRPRATFHCDAAKWQAAWFALVKGTSLDDDLSRAEFIRWHTSEWPAPRRCDSLTVFLSRATDRQASELLDAAREAIAERAVDVPDGAPSEVDQHDDVSPVPGSTTEPGEYICMDCGESFKDCETAAVRKKAGGAMTQIAYTELNPVSLERFGAYFCDLCYDERRWPKTEPNKAAPDQELAF